MELSRHPTFWENDEKPNFCPFWTPFTPYLKNRNLSALETWHIYGVLYYLSSLGDGTKSSSCILLNDEKPNFCPFLDPPYPISQEPKIVCTWNLAHIWCIILSFFSRRWNQIVILHFEKMPITPIFDPFLPNISVKKVFLYLRLCTLM